MSFTTALYNIVEAYSNWLYREYAESFADLKPRTIKHFFIRICFIVIYYPLICPFLSFDRWDTRRRIKRCISKCYRMAANPRTTREDLTKVLSKTFEGDMEAMAEGILRLNGRKP
jgi:hypothetical protein